MDDYKKYIYRELNYTAPKQRSCYTIGKVYTYVNSNSIENNIEDDLLLCISKSGDCHYDFVKIEKSSETSFDSGLAKPSYQLFAYFKLKSKVSSYGGMEEAFPKMEALSELDLVHVLYKNEVLIPLFAVLPDKELNELNNSWVS